MIFAKDFPNKPQQYALKRQNIVFFIILRSKYFYNFAIKNRISKVLNHLITIKFLFLPLCVFFVLCINVAQINHSKDLIANSKYVSSIELPEPIVEQTSDAEQKAIFVTVKKGSTLFDILRSHKIDTSVLHPLMQNKYGRVLNYLQKNEKITLYLRNGRLAHLDYRPNAFKLFSFERINEKSQFKSSKKIETADRSLKFTTFPIEYSLYQSAKSAGLPKSIIITLANIYEWDIDFANDLRRGDRITVIYETLYKNGAFKNYGNIKAAKIINQNKEYYALRFTKDGRSDYYDQYGNNLKKAFLRNPLDFKHISSHFNPSRRHPILNTIRAHNGTDYAASSGTPVRATGDGKISFTGWKGGFGNMVKIRHTSQYETRYAHLNRFARNIKRGKSVRQGTVIGYVGKTGLATGYHLHFEFLKKGKHQNPVTVKLPRTAPIYRKQQNQFASQTRDLLYLLNQSNSYVNDSTAAR